MMGASRRCMLIWDDERCARPAQAVPLSSEVLLLHLNRRWVAHKPLNKQHNLSQTQTLRKRKNKLFIFIFRFRDIFCVLERGNINDLTRGDLVGHQLGPRAPYARL